MIMFYEQYEHIIRPYLCQKICLAGHLLLLPEKTCFTVKVVLCRRSEPGLRGTRSAGVMDRRVPAHARRAPANLHVTHDIPPEASMSERASPSKYTTRLGLRRSRAVGPL